MLRTTQDIVELRRWAEARGARPCRDLSDGHLGLALPGIPCTAQEVGWDEFEPTFAWTHAVFVYDDAPGGCLCFVGATEEAHAFVARETCGAAYAGYMPPMR